jgi:Flp pilus assembly secretin CpaC
MAAGAVRVLLQEGVVTILAHPKITAVSGRSISGAFFP